MSAANHPLRIPHAAPPQWPAGVPETRLASRIRRESPGGCRVGILGLADDLGVRLNGGRPGAKDGPAAFRDALARYGAAEPAGFEWPLVFDAGDIIPAEGADESALNETHRRVTAAAAAMLDAGLIPVGIGGGHDLTFPLVRAVAERFGGRRLSGVYFDAHLDVRPTAGSGMPFRRLVEECGVKRLCLRGFCPLVNTAEHLEWFTSHGGAIIRGELPPAGDRGLGDQGPTYGDAGNAFPIGDLFVSMDLDVLDAAHAPGVSALNPAGWTPAVLSLWAAGAGRCVRVRCFDIMELSPPHDEGGRTARVAAHLFLSFLRGLAERPA